MRLANTLIPQLCSIAKTNAIQKPYGLRRQAARRAKAGP
jgi:hypothetical protein